MSFISRFCIGSLLSIDLILINLYIILLAKTCNKLALYLARHTAGKSCKLHYLAILQAVLHVAELYIYIIVHKCILFCYTKCVLYIVRHGVPSVLQDCKTLGLVNNSLHGLKGGLARYCTRWLQVLAHVFLQARACMFLHEIGQ